MIFLSTPSARRATAPARASKLAACISIHALREEGDLAHGRSASRLPYFYPRPPRGGRLAVPGVGADPLRISIHALREEGDFAFSTISTMSSYFYPRPPRGGRLRSSHGFRRSPGISIPALREEGDFLPCKIFTGPREFLSPPSARRATLCQMETLLRRPISIPALREEGDPQNLFCVVVKPDFYPRPPRGGRHVHVVVRHRVVWDFYPRPPRGGRLFDDAGVVEGSEFLSPPSARRATVAPPPLRGVPDISIPALREEGDSATASFTA